MYAIVETGGKQFRVSEGDVIRTDLIETEVGSSVTFDRVILAAVYQQQSRRYWIYR